MPGLPQTIHLVHATAHGKVIIKKIIFWRIADKDVLLGQPLIRLVPSAPDEIQQKDK